MRYKYLEMALGVIQKVFPNADFDFNGDIVLKHCNALVYIVRTCKYINLDGHNISDEKKADVVANDVIKQLVNEITK